MIQLQRSSRRLATGGGSSASCSATRGFCPRRRSRLFRWSYSGWFPCIGPPRPKRRLMVTFRRRRGCLTAISIGLVGLRAQRCPRGRCGPRSPRIGPTSMPRSTSTGIGNSATTSCTAKPTVPAASPFIRASSARWVRARRHGCFQTSMHWLGRQNCRSGPTTACRPIWPGHASIPNGSCPAVRPAPMATAASSAPKHPIPSWSAHACVNS